MTTEDAQDEPLALSANTQALLDSFLQEKSTEERELQEVSADDRISPANFIKLFKEDWQLSQFWYTPECAERLAKAIRSQVDESSRIAFVCSPTAYVGYRYQYPKLASCCLLEHDDRFGRFAGSEYVPYDLHLSTQLPRELLQSIDLAIVDPPFVNARTNIALAISLKLLLKPQGKLCLITSPEVKELSQIYALPPIGPLHESKLRIDHSGLRNDYACWTSWKEGFPPDAT